MTLRYPLADTAALSAVFAHRLHRESEWRTQQDDHGRSRDLAGPVHYADHVDGIHHVDFCRTLIPVTVQSHRLPSFPSLVMNVLNAAKPPDVVVQPGPEDSISKLAFNPVADFLAVGSWDNQVRREVV